MTRMVIPMLVGRTGVGRPSLARLRSTTPEVSALGVFGLRAVGREHPEHDVVGAPDRGR